MYVMHFVSPKERAFLTAVSQLAYCNPFLPEWVEHERSLLGNDFVEGEAVQSLSVHQPDVPRANVRLIAARLEKLAEELRGRLSRGPAGEHDLLLYEDAIIYLLYHRYYQRSYEPSFGPARTSARRRWRFYQGFFAVSNT